VVRILYKPVGIVFGLIGGLVAGALFRGIWGKVADDRRSPGATDADHGWPEIVAAAALGGAVFGAVKAVVDRAGAAGFAWVTGVWPGKPTRIS
jgi:hypothetical protein